jgi:zinc protease
VTSWPYEGDGKGYELTRKYRAIFASAISLLTPPSLAAQSVVLGTSPIASTWENQGSDIPLDAAWRFGTLPNGVRYAVRRGSQPPGAISVRVRIGVGALMEANDQQGWTHLLEHMVFRGTQHFADGEGIQLWQRLGASFGRDTNAFTTLTSTTFQLDLPHPTAAEFNQALTVLSEMMDSAKLDPKLLTTERQVVDAERAQRFSPLLTKLRAVQQPLFLAGTKASARDVIGTSASLAAATPEALKAYYEAWYRPDNAVVVVAGDADPAILEAGIRQAFGGWKATGPKAPEPDWGTPSAPRASAAVASDPQAPETVIVNFVSAHKDQPFTIARQQNQFVRSVALGILNQRLAAAAQSGQSIVNARVQFSEQRHIEDQLLVQIQPKPGEWQKALEQGFAVLNGVRTSAPDQAEIDQQTANISGGLNQQITSASTQSSPALASKVIRDVEQGDVTGAPEFYRRLFWAQRKSITPAAVQKVLQDLLAPSPRLLVVTPTPIAGGEQAAIAALASAQNVAAGQAAVLRPVSFDQLKLAGTPSSVSSSAPIPELGAERIRFSNGVELVFKNTDFERGAVRVGVLVGRGLLDEPRNSQGLWWTSGGLTAAGIGPFDVAELERVTAGHRVVFRIAPALEGLSFSGESSAADIGNMLKLVTAELTQPRFDPTVLTRLKSATASNYASIFSQPMAVLNAFGGPALHGGDKRFQSLPDRNAIDSLSLTDFRSFWTKRLAEGPIRVVVVGDADRSTIVSAVARTLGTLPLREPEPRQGSDVRAVPPAAPVVLRHRGDAGQAVLVRAFPTLGSLEDVSGSAALNLAAVLIQTRLTEGFRESAGGSYTPIASHSQSTVLPHYGVLLAGAQVQTKRVEEFRRSLDAVLLDLASQGPSADEFVRAQATILSTAGRSRANNAWWVGALASDLTPARISALANYPSIVKALTPGSIKQVTTRYLAPTKGFTIEVLPAPEGTSTSGR